MPKLAYRIFPAVCILCDVHGSHDRDLCGPCEADLPRLGSVCARCGVSIPGARVEGTSVCGACLTRPPPFARCIAPFHYAAPVDRLITQFKFSSRILAGRILAVLLAEDLAKNYGDALPDIVVPMPLHRKRYRTRGFNQAEVLSSILSKHLGIPSDARICERTQDRPAQSGLPAAARKANVRGTFKVRGNVTGMSVAIVDDVVTTGSTAYELSTSLLGQGASEVHLWALARSTLSSSHHLNLLGNL